MGLTTPHRKKKVVTKCQNGGKRPLGRRADVAGRIISEWLLERKDEVVWTGFI
jgi:hypothetical protein